MIVTIIHSFHFRHLCLLAALIIFLFSNNTRSINLNLAEILSPLSHSTVTAAPPTPAIRSFSTVEAEKTESWDKPGILAPLSQPPKTQVVSVIASALNQSQPSFQLSKCNVISSININKEHMTSLDQNKIRKTISKNYSPLIISP